MQTKTLDFPLEIKSVSESGTVEGWAACYGNVDHGMDVIELGAFKSLEDRPYPMLWGHDMLQPIGVWDELKDAPGGRQGGLYAKGRMFPEDDPLARRILTLVKNKAVNGMSIGYRVPPGGAEPDSRRPGVRRLKMIDLIEVSLVTLPMNDQARIVSAKADDPAMEWWPLHDMLRDLETADDETVAKAMKEIEDKLHSGGCPKSLRPFFAKRFVSGRSESGRPPHRGEPEGPKATTPADVARALLAQLG